MCKLENLFRAISKGNLKLVTEILSTQNIIDQDWNDYKLLLLALKQNQKEIAKVILDYGCRVQDASKKDFIGTPIYYVIEMQDSEMIQLILNKNFSFNSIDHQFQSPFESILKLNDRQVVNKILSAYVNENINPTDYAGFCPFFIACYVGDTTIVKFFLHIDQSIINRRVKDSARNFPGFSPLHFAAQSGDLETIEILLSHGADITIKDKSGMSAFHLACDTENEQIRDLFMKILFERNAHCVQDEGFSVIFKRLMYKHMIQLNRKYEESDVAWDSWTPLHYAVTLRKPELIELLLKKKTNIDAKDNKGLAPLHLACQCSFEELSKTISTNNEGFNFLINDACYYKMKIKIQKLLAPPHKDPRLCFLEFENFKQELIVNPDVKNTVIKKRKEIIRLLLRHGADVNIADNIGATPLHDLLVCDYFFEENDKIEIIKQILNKGAEVNAKTKGNIVPLYLALRYSFLDVARILIDHNADVESHMEAPVRTNHQFGTSMKFMKTQQRFSPIQVLLCNAIDVNKKLSILKLLLENGADPNMRDSSDFSVLEWAIFRGQTSDEKVDKVVLTLLQFGAEINSRNRTLQTPLHYACSCSNYGAASVLLYYGADINATDVYNRTPLWFLASHILDASKNFSLTIKQHVIKLKHIGLYVSQENEKWFKQFERSRTRFFPIEIGNFSEQCAEEADRLKKTKINKYTTLHDILLKDELNDLVGHAHTFKEIVESNDFSNKFKIYGFLLKLKYEKILKRKLLVNEAEKALNFSTKWKIPDLCIRMIIANLSNENLQALITAYTNNVNDVHLFRSGYKKCNSLPLRKRKRVGEREQEEVKESEK